MTQELQKLISSLSEDNFRNLIKEYLKQKYITPHVRIVDGPYDGGNDLEIIIGEKELRKNIQVTVQKVGYELKLEKDLQKASDNVKDYNYQKSLDFYISSNITKDKKNQLIMKAEVDFGINLTVIDPNILAQESEQYSSIRDFTYSAHNIRIDSNVAVADKQTKILYDVLTLDHNSVEIKKNFITSYIFSFLYTKPLSSINEIFGYINPHLNNTLDMNFLDKELNYLRSKKHLVSLSDKTKFQLSDDKRAEISLIFSSVTVQEQQLNLSIQEFITKHGINCECLELIEILYKLYQENYTIDIEEVKSTNSTFSASIKKNFNDLIGVFTKKKIPIEEAKIISKELLELCENNDYLNKLSTIHLFNNLYSSDKLEKYVNAKMQKMFVDTQILIRLICVLYNEKIEYSDTALQSVKILMKTLDKFKDKITIYSSYDYVGEVAGHLQLAFKLQRFMKLPYLSSLGKSKNVFYNTYLDLKQNDCFDEDTEFIDFIEELLDEEIDFYDGKEFLRVASNRIEEILEQSNINLIYHPTYPNFPSIKREYEMSLSYQAKNRSFTALENDLRTMLWLSSKENHQNKETGEIEEPFLITWDSAFYSFRKKVLNAHKELTYWYIYPPLKVVDRLSVMNFNLNPQSISLNIVALTETNFNYSTKTTSFIDVISSYFNAEDLSKLSIINKLANLKNSTKNLDETPVVDEMREDENDNLTHLLLSLRSHYTSFEAKFKFDDIIRVFELPSHEDEIISIFTTALPEYRKEAKL